MSNRARPSEEDTRRLIVAITDFLRDQLGTRTDFVPEDRDCLEIAIQCLEMAYGLDPDGYIQLRFSRPLLDIFTQVTNPVPVKDKLRADALKDEGNSYMRRSMYQEAETAYTSAIALDRWNSIYYCNRASARISQQNYFEAISDCRQALVLNPDYAKAHAKMGQSYALLNRAREAARCFRQAAELEPDNERYRNNLRVAESQITRPDAMGLITNLLNSIFGLNTDQNSGSSSMALPASFMIITESHPTPQNILPTESAVVSTGTERKLSGRRSQDTAVPLRYGVVDEGAEEQSIVDMDLPESIEVRRRGGSRPEIILEIPLFGDTQEDHSTPCTCERHSVSEEGTQEQETPHKCVQTPNCNKVDTNEVSHEKESTKVASTDTYESAATETVKETTDTSRASQNAKQEASSYNGEIFQDEATTAGNATHPDYLNFKNDSIQDNTEGKTESKNNISGNRLVQTEEGKDDADWAEFDFVLQNEFSRNNKQDSSELKSLSVEEEAARTIPYNMQQDISTAENFPPKKENVDTSVSVGAEKSGQSTSDCAITTEDRKASINDEKSTIQNSESTFQEKVNNENLEENKYVSENEKIQSDDDNRNQN